MTENPTNGTDIEARSEVARFLGKECWPADRDRLTAVARDNQATDRVLELLGTLPAGSDFANLQAVAEELGLADPREEGPGAD